MSLDTRRLLFTGPFHADHRARALRALHARSDGGARDILYIVASAGARRRAVQDLLAGRPAVFGVRVVTLRGLPAELARRAHANKPQAIDRVIERLLVERELRVATGNRFGGSTPVSGLAAKAASTIDVLERNGARPEQLAGLLAGEKHGEAARVLADVWRALSLKRSRYGASDAELLVWATEVLRSSPSVLEGLDLLVLEDLSLLTPVERSLGDALISAVRSDVIACHAYAPQLPDAPATRSLTVLRTLAAWEETRGEARETFVGRLFASATEVQPRATTSDTARPGITLLEATGDLGEVRLAARVVRRHLDAGAVPTDIALVIHGSAARYRELVREVFDAAGVPVSVTRPRPLSDTGIGGALLQLLELAIHPDRATREASLAASRAPHVDLRRGEADRLEHGVIVKGYLGLDGWDDLAFETLGRRGANRVNRLKRVVATARSAFASVSSATSAAHVVRQLARELRLVNNAYVARRRVTHGAGSADPLHAKSAIAVREDNLAWEAIESTLDDTVPRMMEIERGAANRPGSDYAAAWLALFSRAMRETPVLAERPPAGAVQLRGTGPGCEAPARITIILGLAEKIFPRQARPDPFLGDTLRESLRAKAGWDLTTSADAIHRERECFVRAVSSATDALYLSYSATDGDGRPAVRSFFIDDLQLAVGDASSIRVERAESPSAIARVSDAATRSELVTAIAHDIWQHLPRTVEPSERRATAFRALEALVRREADVAVIRHGRRVNQRPVLEDVLPPDAPHRTLTLSASQLGSISHCTYRHYVEKVLSPIGFVPPEYNALEKGSLIHKALMYWSTALDGWKRGEPALPALLDWCRAQIDEWSPALRGAERTARATQVDLARLEELLRAELTLLRAPGVAQPTFAELAFGEDMEAHGQRDPASRSDAFPLSVRTSVGDTTANFRGSMDRVDVITVGDRRYGVIIDYKTGRTSKRYADAMMAGDDLQLRLYLLVLERFWGITPIGALYLGFGDGVRRGVVRAELADVIAGIDHDVVEVLAPDEWDAFVTRTSELIAHLVDRLVRVDVTPAPHNHDCGYCQLTPICRYDRWAPEATGV